MRNFLVCLLVGGLATSMLSSVASAQGTGTGAITGQLVLCGALPRPLVDDSLERTTEFSPVGASQPQPEPDPSGVVPAVRLRGKFVKPVPRSAANVELSVEGTSLTVLSDANGRFFLAGVPAAQRLTLKAVLAAGRPPVALRPNLIVDAGQTVDVGVIELGDCLRTLLPDGGTDEQVVEPTQLTQPSEFQLAPADVQPTLVEDSGSE
jgi:hypothetical protein